MANFENVNIYLEAKSKDELIAQQILNNNVNQVEYGYQTPMKDGSKWIVWFTADLRSWIDHNTAPLIGGIAIGGTND